ncbi:MAG: FixH family protein [Saprospiraceae bacterium]
MKINWGTGIFIFYSCFAMTLFFQVYKSTQYDHSLVVEDYYAKDLAYQTTFDKLENSMALKIPMQIDYHKRIQQIELVFPNNAKLVTGNILLYRASDKKADVLLPIKVNAQNNMTIDVETLKAGRWKIEVDWVANKIPYLNRKTIEIPETEENYLSQVY